MSNTLLIGLGSLSLGGAVALGLSAFQQALDRFNGRTHRDLEQRMRTIGMNVSRLPLELVLWRAAVVGNLLLFWFVLNMPPFAVFMAFLTHKLGPVWFDLRIAGHLRRIREQVVIAARLLAGQVRVGMALEEAIAVAGKETPQPFGWHLQQTANQLEQGRDIRQVLADLKERLEIDAVALLVIALRVAAERGGKLAEVLERIGHSLEEMMRVTRKRETDTAAGRLMVLLMALFPAVFLGMFYVLDPQMIATLFARTSGQIVLSGVGLLVYVSVRWAARILSRVE